MSLSKKALIIGVGNGLSLSLARLFHKQGMSISLVARNINKLENIKKELEANVFKCDVSSPIEVKDLFIKLDDLTGMIFLKNYIPVRDSLKIVGKKTKFKINAGDPLEWNKVK